MILVIDNYDSFTYNLVQYIEEIGYSTYTCRNDKIDISRIKKINPQKIVISPGPGRPDTLGGVSCAVIQEFYRSRPILGVCLGHQCIGYVFGARIVKAPRLMHGKTSLIYHDRRYIFKNISSPFTATRYHSLIVERGSISNDLIVNAWTKDGIIMGIRHKKYPLFGVQFHPESILTQEGKKLLKNFLEL